MTPNRLDVAGCWMIVGLLLTMPQVAFAQSSADSSEVENGAATSQEVSETGGSQRAQYRQNSDGPSDDGTETEGEGEGDAPERAPGAIPREPFWTWDLKLEGGVAKQARSWGAMGGLRTGATFANHPNAYTAGVTGELSSLNRHSAGLELEFLSLRYGTFLQLGGLMDFAGRPTATASVGWYTWALEFQYEPQPDFNRDSRWILMGKLNLPVSWLIRAFAQ